MSQVALVTGATEGIGRAIAFALGRAGHAVGVCARTADRLRTLLAALETEGIRAAGIPADVGDDAAVERLVSHVTDTLGPVHTLVNNAGIGILKPISRLSPDEWDATMRTNVRGMFLMTRAVLPAMRAARTGAIVNIASLAGRNGIVGGTAYCASKHAVLGFSKALMLEVRQEGIRVIAICPGSVDTGFGPDRVVPKLNRASILRPEDVADAVVAALRLPERALVSELDLRPTTPQP